MKSSQQDISVQRSASGGTPGAVGSLLICSKRHFTKLLSILRKSLSGGGALHFAVGIFMGIDAVKFKLLYYITSILYVTYL